VTDDASETPEPPGVPTDPPAVPVIDTSVPHSARIWTYWLGGTDHYAVDREAGERVRETFPGIVDLARIGRYFLGRVVRYLAGEAGVRQFLDIGSGLPTVDNTHEVAQRIAPEARIVYVDNDPLVFSHAQALLTSAPPGATDYIPADVRDPDTILARAAKTLDLSRPVGLILMGVLAHVPDYDEARAIVRRLLAALPPGSYLAVRDGTDTDPDYSEAVRGYNATGAVPYHLRPPEQIAGFLDGLDLIEPGVVPCPLWRPDAPPLASEQRVALLGGVGRKP
jgi:O-methyltransferase involved in polyketide biosynthesis